MEPKRIKEIEDMTVGVSTIADMPDHMIHLNGDKFLGPRNIIDRKEKWD